MIETRWARFAGANIKGTPSMSAAKVAADIELLRRNCSVMVLQEFRWPWYWRTIAKSLGSDLLPGLGWRTAPGMAAGLRSPVFSAQAVAWRDSRWRRKEVRRRKLHDGMAKISETRWIRSALLEDRATQLECWFGTTHAVVKGDEPSDSPMRKAILDHDLMVMHSFLRQLKATGHPVIFQADLNVHPGTWAYRDLLSICKAVGARIVGEHGVEYLFIMDQHSDVKVQVAKDWVIRPNRLNTDHEVRGMTFRLVLE